jgi:hypothetical protein
MPKCNLTPEEKEKILLQAKAIEHLKILLPKLPLEQKLKLGSAGYSEVTINPPTVPSPNTNVDWMVQLRHEIFWPLLEQGYEKYVEAIIKIAETGERS